MAQTTESISPGSMTFLPCAIVVPCYNEEARFHASDFATFLAQGYPVRFVFVNDGSSDGTLAMLEAFRDAHPDAVQVVNQQPNVGKAEAVRRAMLQISQAGAVEAVGFWDADLATPLDAIPDFLHTLAKHPQVEMVFGARVRLLGRSIHRKFIRHYLGRGFATAVSIMLRLPIYDTQCGAKLFRVSPMLISILTSPFQSRWIFDVEIIARLVCSPGVGRTGAMRAIYELPLKTWRDVDGSKLSSSDFLRSLVDLIKIRHTYFGK